MALSTRLFHSSFDEFQRAFPLKRKEISENYFEANFKGKVVQ
ncbi:MAG: hypothetical protein EZS28_007029, partial [Streblomastix strix]